MGTSGLNPGLFQAFIDWLYSSGEIAVPVEFHDQCIKINDMLHNDVTGMINTLVDYQINAASEAQYKIECPNNNLESLLNEWLENINININGIPTGLQELSKEYFKERWAGSSLCLLRVSNWEDIVINGMSISVPTVLWFVNGSSVYIKRENEKNFKLGSDKYYLDGGLKQKVPAGTDEEIVVQKPFGRWFDKYPVPYLIRKGVFKNYLGIKTLQTKSDEVITKVLPYLFIIEKGTQELFNAGVNYDDKDLKKLVDAFRDELEKYKNERARTPTNAVPFDQKYQHLIPDLRNIMTEELYHQGYRALLSGLGFVDIIQGISSTRREAVLNPKPFISEIGSGVDGFKSLLLDVINLIINNNKEAHRKIFSTNNKIKIVSSPLKINVESILDVIRSGYDRGALSIQSYIEAIGFDFDKEKERRQKELEAGDEDLFYPHLIQNREDIPDRMGLPSTPRKQTDETNETQNKKKGTPESQNFKQSIFEEARVDITENYIRIRQLEPSEFEEDSFRTITLSKSQGIKAVIGKRKNQKTTTIQSYLFDKDKWTKEEALKWVKDHEGKANASIEFILENLSSNIEEDLEKAPYTMRNLPPAIKKLSKDLQNLWIRVWNENYERYHDESRAHRTAWYVVNKERNKLHKEAKLEAEIKEKQKKLIDKVLGEDNETL